MPESSRIPVSRQYLQSARAELFQHAQGVTGPVPRVLVRAAEHIDAALTELDTYGVDVRPGVPDDFLPQ